MTHSKLAKKICSRYINAQSKAVKLFNLYKEYYEMIGSNKRPNKQHIMETLKLGLIDEEIRRMECMIMEVEMGL